MKSKSLKGHIYIKQTPVPLISAHQFPMDGIPRRGLDKECLAHPVVESARPPHRVAHTFHRLCYPLEVRTIAQYALQAPRWSASPWKFADITLALCLNLDAAYPQTGEMTQSSRSRVNDGQRLIRVLRGQGIHRPRRLFHLPDL